ncbi:MAG: hypothetical protein IJ617_03100 [Oscillospiraceae bacterium]|nr:hypothetical protein [Oscillospiraceae bacterium]
MNIGQIARNQGMIYSILNRSSANTAASASNSQKQAQSLDYNALQNTYSTTRSRSEELTSESLMRSLGYEGLKGDTVREMAKYQMQLKTQNAQQSQATDSLSSQLSLSTQYTPISDDATKAMQDLALKDALASVGEGSAPTKSERNSLVQEQLRTVSPTKRLAAFNTMNKVWQNEIDRIGSYIKEKDPSWNTWGDSFDASILNEYKAGVNIFV